MHRPSDDATTVVPDHDPINKGTLKSILNDAGLTVDQFVALL